jgi:hypothetical protein
LGKEGKQCHQDDEGPLDPGVIYQRPLPDIRQTLAYVSSSIVPTSSSNSKKYIVFSWCYDVCLGSCSRVFGIGAMGVDFFLLAGFEEVRLLESISPKDTAAVTKTYITPTEDDVLP